MEGGKRENAFEFKNGVRERVQVIVQISTYSSVLQGGNRRGAILFVCLIMVML